MKINQDNQNPFNKIMQKIFHKVYLANVRNRLRELDNPGDIDCKRWVWELVQNAKDSIAGQKDRKGINIEINVENDNYKFIHNGSPFTMDTLTALIYKYSEGKTNDCESTGRFGTGFLTTHSLSKTVKITSDVVEEDDLTPHGFTITMFREGEENELLDGLEKTENSFQKLSQPLKTTTYEYIAKTERNKEAGKLGIRNFKENIPIVMLYCPEINNIKLNDNGKIFTIERDNDIKSISEISDGFQQLSLKIKDDNKEYKRKFIYYKIDEYNEELTTKFGKERNLRICCSIELDENNNIVVNNSLPCLFCSLPLVGSESHEFPFFINSPDFEPDSERQAILLDGNEKDENTGKISTPGINKMILLRTTKIFKLFLDYINKINVGKRYLLTRGLVSIPHITRFFDSKWYEKNFLTIMRDILIEYPIIWDGSKYKKLTEVYIPLLNDYNENNNDENKRKEYNFISQLYDNRVPSYDDSISFEGRIWDNDSRIEYKNLKNCVETVEEYKNITIISNKMNNIDIWKWIDDFLKFIKDFHNKFLNEYAIIPNMNSEFVKLTSNIASSKSVPDNMIECLESLEVKWKENHTHKNLSNFTVDLVHNIDYALLKMLECVENWSDKVLILMHYIPKDNNNEFIQKREMIYEFCSLIWKDKMSQKKDGTNFPIKLWDKIDEMVMKKIIEKIEKCGCLSEVYTIEFINKFLKCYSESIIILSGHSIIPNENGKFCKIGELYVDDNIPEIFKKCLKKCFSFDINEELINKQITNIKPKISRNIYNYKSIINKYLRTEQRNNNSKVIPLEKKKEAAEYLIRIIPKKDENNSDNNLYNKQTKLFEIYKFFTGNNCESYEIEQNNNYEDIWESSNTFIYLIIREIIEKEDNIDSLAIKLKKNKESIIENLKQFIKFSSTGKIIPNQNNKFCEESVLSNEIEWKDSETLKNISFYLGYDVKEELAHISMEKPCSRNMRYDDICKKIDKLMSDKYRQTSNHQDSNYKNAAKLLLDYFDDIGEKEAKKYFDYTFSIKEKIAYNVIYNEKTRKSFAELEKLIDINNFSYLLKESKTKNIIKKLINDEKAYQFFAEIEERYDRESLSILMKSPKEIKEYIEFEKKFGKDTISTLLNNSNIRKNVVSLINNEKICADLCKYDISDINKLFCNPNIIKSIINGELSDSNYKDLHGSSYSKPIEINNGTNSISVAFNSEISQNEYTLNLIFLKVLLLQ